VDSFFQNLVFAALLFVFSREVVAQRSSLPPVPEFPSYPAPVIRLEEEKQESIYFSSDSPVDFRAIFDSKSVTPTTVEGFLKLPEGASSEAKVPVMVILHGSRGITKEREWRYSEFLAENGIASFLIDSYAARGVTRKTPYQLRIVAVTEADLVTDAYAALRVLQTHPALDSSRIGLMGFSYGGIATRFALDRRFYDALGKELNPFSLHVDFYGPCFMDIQTTETTGAPFLSLRGGLDESNDLVAAAKIEHQLRRAGSYVSSRIYGTAAHGWEFSTPQTFVKTLNPAPCSIVVNKEGDFSLNSVLYSSEKKSMRLQKIAIRAQILNQIRDTCIAEGYTIGRNERSDRLAEAALLEAISSEFSKGKAKKNVKISSGTRGMIACPEPLAAQAGLEILKNGGNAVDAAVAVGFALAVTYPNAGNIGGGGFMIIHDAESENSVAIDYREKAPKAASRDMFLNDAGGVDIKKSRFSHLSAGVPGTVSGLALALEKYGTISLADALAPAIRMAADGTPMSQSLYRTLNSKKLKDRLLKSPAASAVFYGEDGESPLVGELLVQADLAWSLREIALEGVSAFYEGEIARLLVEDMQQNGGLITADDLSGYNAVLREPVRGVYRGVEVLSMPPPSSGGVHLVQMLNMLERFDLAAMEHNTPEYIHLLAEVMKRAYADRSKYLGDSDFFPVPVTELLSQDYAERRISDYDPGRATPSGQLGPGEIEVSYESHETTHFSIVDRWGNAVSNTYTLNFNFGSGQMAPGTGILLNNEMDDFSSKPGVPNGYGLVGGDANAIEPEKRMLSSMTPIILKKDGELLLVTGSPGGSTIITTVLQMVLNVVDHGMDLRNASLASRIHHQWLPDRIRVEEGSLLDVQRGTLHYLGHSLEAVQRLGKTNSIMVEDGILFGVADPRYESGVALGF